ncbi:TlpA family protein disulfide reductase [Dyadobacter sp. CY261]|uniref:TlpA family protein disulfide reductase n=1 Tax=Dyadobacter sp. CY261 TaxID=2907203 RepID=UPI001F20B763|nr:TlpA disulfide reductase family protein [Dyadobacter sp. CY261]MCF0073882.1 TlpA family protein disulfide reductase [Dyadobacter sp. CY261]
MRQSFFLSLFLIIILIENAGCDRRGAKITTIAIHFPKAANDTVKIATANMVDLDVVELGKVKLDSNGNGALEFALETPLFAFSNSKHMVGGFYIVPGSKVTLVQSQDTTSQLADYEGDGAIFNRYLRAANDIRNGLEKWKGKHAIELEAGDFINARDSLQKAYDQLESKMKTEKDISEEMRNLLALRNRMSVLFYQYNFAIGRDSANTPASVREAVKHMPVDTIALKTRMYDYGLIASYFFQHEIINEISVENEEMDGDSLAAIFPQLADEKIKQKKYPKLIEDYLRTKSADYQIRMDGLSPNIGKLVSKLEKEVVADEFKSTIRADVARWEKIGPGKLAPDFSGTTPGGKKISLSELRGKVVYVDIWATWCGPCLEEFPYSKKIETGFKDNDKIAFLYVSVDRDTLAWKKMVASGKVPPGIHIQDNAEPPGSIWNLYHVWGVPRYLLIDAAGRMVATHAERPSSGKLTAELRKLLSTKELANN